MHMIQVTNIIILDINECSEGLSSCNQLCTNTIGSYDCECYHGFSLNSDNHTCQGRATMNKIIVLPFHC